MEKGFTKNDSLAIKGIAILMMLFHHLYTSTDRFAGYDISFSPFGQDFVVDIALLFKVCVSIFAFITGYGLFKSISKVKINQKNIDAWNISRLIKTLSGFWFVYIVAFIVTMIINKLPITTYFSGDNKLDGILYMINDFFGLANLLDTPSLCSTWWYMSAAVVFILLVPIFYVIAKKVGYLPIVISLCALPRLMNVGYPGGINVYTFILPVVFGMMFADYNIFEKISSKKLLNKHTCTHTHIYIYI